MAIQKIKMSKILNILQAKYVSLIPSFDFTILELIVFRLLHEKENKKNVEKALKLLKNEFVDWNEIRVTHPREIEEVLKKYIKHDVYSKAVIIQEMLSEIFLLSNTMNLEYLGEKDFHEIKKYIQKLNLSVAFLLDILLYATSTFDIPFSQNFLRVGKRLGLWDDFNNAIAKKIDSNLKSSLHKLNAYFFIHGEEICIPTGYDCSSCILLKDCNFGQKQSEKKSKVPVTKQSKKTKIEKTISQKTKMEKTTSQAASKKKIKRS